MKIDLVYLWVDGSDEKWLAKKNAELEKIGKLPVEAAGDYRCYDNDELRLSLRSAEKFAAWVNHIFIVTDDQTPKWLNVNNPKITIVNQNDIMPKDALPCFNSNVIESFLPNIPNLSEYFIYANDDMLFMAKTKPSYFFTKNGVPIVRVNNTGRTKKRMRNLFPVGQKFNTMWENASIYISSILNSFKLVYDIVGDYSYGWREAHNIDPYRKSDMVNIANIPLVKEKMEVMKKKHFRDKSDVQRILFHLFGVAKYGYKMVGKDFWTQMAQYLTFRFRDIPTYTDDVRKKMMRTPLKRKLICVQDTRDGKYRESNRNYLLKMFPKKSEFEK